MRFESIQYHISLRFGQHTTKHDTMLPKCIHLFYYDFLLICLCFRQNGIKSRLEFFGLSVYIYQACRGRRQLHTSF